MGTWPKAVRVRSTPWASLLILVFAGCTAGSDIAAQTPAPSGAARPSLTIVAAAAPPTQVVAAQGTTPTSTPQTPRQTLATAAASTNATVPSTIATPTLVPSPPPLALVVLPAGTGDGPPDLAGEIRSAAGTFEVETHVSGKPLYRFTHSLVLEANVTAIPAGAQMSEVLFRFTSLDNATDFDTRIERTPLYCAFGGGEPDCSVVNLRAGARWPGSGGIITNGVYCFSGRALLDNGATRTWRLLVEIRNPALPPDPSAGIQPVSGTVPPASPCLR